MEADLRGGLASELVVDEGVEHRAQPEVAERVHGVGTRPEDGRIPESPWKCGRVALGELVLRSTGALVEVGRSWPGLSDPAGVGVGGDRVTQVLQGVQDIHRHVLGFDLRLAAAGPAEPWPGHGLHQRAATAPTPS